MSAQTISENQKLFDRYIEHYMETRRFEKNLRIRQDKLHQEHQRTIRAALLENLRAPIQKVYQTYTKTLRSFGIDNVTGFLADEVDFHKNSLRISTGNFYDVRLPSKAQVRDQFLSTGIFNQLPMDKQYTNIGTSAFTNAENIIKRGLAENRSPEEIVKDILRSSELSNTQAKALLRTSMTRAEVDALRAVVEANKDVIKGYEYTAILDARTSSLCSSLDGSFIKPDETYKFPPRHFNCRSSVVPILKSKQEMLESESPRISKRKLDRVSNTVLNGEQSAKEDFGQWLYRQDFQTKLRHLGSEERVAMFEQGALEVKDFFGSQGKPISMKRLKLLSAQRMFLGSRYKGDGVELLEVKNSRQLLNNPKTQQQLRDLYIKDSTDASQALSLVDYRGTTLQGKRGVRRQANNVFDERNYSFDPLTGEQGSTLYYDPDFEYYQTRLDYARNSKLLTPEQREFVVKFGDSLEDKVSRNQQTAIVENLRVVLERANRPDAEDWGNLATVLRSEMQYSVTNVSRGLDRRSRAAAKLFSSVPGEESTVYILGERYTFDELAENYHNNLLYLRTWSDKEGLALAREAYYSGRVPLRSYFKLRPLSSEKSLRDALRKGDPIAYAKAFAKLKKKELLKPLNNLLDQYWYQNKENYFQKLVREKQEQLYRILDLEFLYRRQRRALVKPGELFLEDEKSIKTLAKMFESLAKGEATDYDSIAISLGDEFYKNFGIEYPFMSVTLRDKHRMGSQLLDGMKEAGWIRVENRGVVRRAVLDIDTGRPAARAYKDTLSREVVLVDKRMKEYQAARRREIVGSRLGIIGRENDLKTRRGSIYFYDPAGNKTDIKLITTRASKSFDEKMVDQDVLDFINKAMDFEFETDQDFAPFMERVLRFRDPRGNTEYYDELNSFRRLVIKRQEQGEGFMQTVAWHTRRGKPFRNRAQIDSRGRLYFSGYLTPTGGEVVRPFLNTAKAKQVTPDAVKELQRQLGALLGKGDDALSDRGRLKLFKEFEDDILSLGDIILAKTQPDRRIREFLEHPIISQLDGEEVPMIARLALEYKRIHAYSGGSVLDPKALAGYQTKLMAEIDASASAVQMISLATGNKNLAYVSNVVETVRKNRIYDLVSV
jgi:SPP1 gp7 family putative phage head morphogenesis protein